MAVPTIVVYSYSTNRDIIRLSNAGEPVSLKSVTKIELRLDSGRVLSSKIYDHAINWNIQEDPGSKGEVYLQLGRLFFATKEYIADVMVFDDLNFLGVFWGYLRIRAIEGNLG